MTLVQGMGQRKAGRLHDRWKWGAGGSKSSRERYPSPFTIYCSLFSLRITPAGSLFLATGWYQQRGLGTPASLFSQRSVPTQGAQKMLEGEQSALNSFLMSIEIFDLKTVLFPLP